jgi:DNA/RNA endonuclease YhcR with UshA esterase domain
MATRFLLLTLSVLVACGDDSEQPSATPIAEARNRATGAEVTVEGYVTVQPGAFSSALGNEGFALQDNSGGIYVKLAQKLEFGLGTRVRVKGTLNEENNLRILESEPGSVETLSGTQQVAPSTVSTGTVREPTEGLLVRVTATVTQPLQDELPYGYQLYVDDGSGEVQVYIHPTAGFTPESVSGLTVGQTIEVTGLPAQYESTYEVAPRQPSDIVLK